jgi:type I restriction enzyme R subunit
VVLFVNGLPLALIELKNAADEDATIWSAYQQLQTYQAELPTLFAFNAALVVSDGVEARIGTLTAGREWFKPWRTISGERLADPHLPELQVMLEGVFDQRRLLDLVRHFIVFEDAGGGPLVKKMAGYHQFHAVNVAVAETLRAAQLRQEADRVAEPAGRYEAGLRPGGHPGDRRIGVVWHTQGSGKSLTMAFYAGRVICEPRMANPTIVALTDRNDLDDQLFGTFSRCQDLLRQPPVQADSRADLRGKLAVEAGGVVFTTIHKFFPEEKGDRHPMLSARRNIVVIADEAHRSQYDFIDGFARHMRDALPNASFIGFTGTSIPSLRWLDIQIRKSRIINRIHKGSGTHVSMAGRRRVPHRILPESSLAGECQGFAGAWPSLRSPVYFAQWSSHASGSAPPSIGPGYGESSAMSAGNGSRPPVPVATPTHRASHGR